MFTVSDIAHTYRVTIQKSLNANPNKCGTQHDGPSGIQQSEMITPRLPGPATGGSGL